MNVAQLPIPRATIEDIAGQRDAALRLFSQAHDSLSAAYESLRTAHETVPGKGGSTSYDLGNDKQAEALLPMVKVPELGDFISAARFIVDRQVWGHVIGMTDLERLMDKTAKDGFRQQLMKEPPEFTAGNVVATLRQFVADADTIFKRGIAVAFSALDRRFRSHDGWKIGSRVILDRAFSGMGSWNYYSNQRDSLQDIERVFQVLDEKPAPDGDPVPTRYPGIVAAIEEDRHGKGYGAKQSESESEYFKARCYLNGNLHLWFKRDDLVDRVNRLLGEYYGAPIPEERGADEDTGLNNPKTALAKNYGFFPTPDAAAEKLIECAGLYCSDGAILTVLEPSAGAGNLAARCVKEGAKVDCIEVHIERAGALSGAKIYRRVIAADFLTVRPTELYDRVVMNPPFDRERDIDHVVHAMKFLKPNGRLAAIMSAGTEFRETRKSRAFRDLMTAKKARWRDLQGGSFSSVGTNCNTVILAVNNDGREIYI